MRRSVLLALAAATLSSALHHAALADDPAVPVFDDAAARHFFNERGCNACHAVDEQRIGPPFRAVAARYRNTAHEIEGALVHKVLHGGAGAWGSVPMVSSPRVPRAEARAAIRWILALDPAP